MKCCTRCKATKEPSEFHKRSRSPDGLHFWCRDCYNESRRAYRSTNEEYREKAKRNCREWHAKNADVARARANAHYHNNKNRHRHTRMLRKYGIGLSEYEAILAAQGGVCAICGRRGPTRGDGMLHVDHDHKTGAVRGLLCSPCNTVLGFLEDNQDAMRAAIAYLANPPASRLLEASLDA